MVSEATSKEVDERLGEANGNVKLMLSNFLGIKEELEQMKKERDEGLKREVVEIQNHISHLGHLHSHLKAAESFESERQTDKHEKKQKHDEREKELWAEFYKQDKPAISQMRSARINRGGPNDEILHLGNRISRLQERVEHRDAFIADLRTHNQSSATYENAQIYLKSAISSNENYLNDTRTKLKDALFRTNNNCKTCYEHFPINDPKKNNRCVNCWDLLKCYRCRTTDFDIGDTEEEKETWRSCELSKLQNPLSIKRVISCADCSYHCRRCDVGLGHGTRTAGAYDVAYCHKCSNK